ncbi:O-antigen ligase family protein [bacterium]|nr:O-antigen ligase family protein [bacterium]
MLTARHNIDKTELIVVIFILLVFLPLFIFLLQMHSFLLVFLVLCILIPASFLLSRPHISLILLAISTPITQEWPIPFLQGFIPSHLTVSGFVFTVDDIIIFSSLFILFMAAIFKRVNFSAIPFRRKIYFLLIVYAIATIQGVFFVDSVKSMAVMLLYWLKWMEYIAIVFLVVHFLKIDKIRKLQRIVGLAILALLVSSSFGIVQFFIALRNKTWTAVGRVPRVDGFFASSLNPKFYGWSIDANNFGVYLVLVISICLGLLLYSRLDKKYKWFLITSSIIGGVCLVFTFSRSAAFTGIASLFVLSKWKPRKVFLTICIFLIIISAVYFPFIQSTLSIQESWFTKFAVLLPSIQGGQDLPETGAVYRWKILSNVPMLLFSKHLLLGHGYSAFRFYNQEYFSIIGMQGYNTSSLYNFFVTVLYDAGLPGIISWCLVLYSIYSFLSKAANKLKNSFLRGFSRGLYAGFIGIFTSSLFMATFHTWRVMGVFWFLLGLLILGVNLDSQLRQNVRNANPRQRL